MLFRSIFFRAAEFPTAWTMAKAWLWWESPGAKVVELWSPTPGWTLPVRCVALATPLVLLHAAAAVGVHRRLRALLPAPLVTLLFGAIAALALAFMPLQARPFIYFQF